MTVDNGIASRRRAWSGPTSWASRCWSPTTTWRGTVLPEAAAIVNPNQPGCPFPSKHLAGVGVVFYLLAALRAQLRDRAGSVRPRGAQPGGACWIWWPWGRWRTWSPSTSNNRILVEQGLRRIRAGQWRPGVRALLAVAGRDPDRAVARDLGFLAAPRLNAAGRLTEMTLGVECLLTDDPVQATGPGARARRPQPRAPRDRGWDAGGGRGRPGGAESGTRRGCRRRFVSLARAGTRGWSGIVAARIRERYQRPVIAFADAGEDGRLRGSARSVEGLQHPRPHRLPWTGAIPG